MDGDGHDDLAIGTGYGEGLRGAAYIVHGPVSGAIDVRDTPTIHGDTATSLAFDVSILDHDVDGVADILTAAQDDADAYLFLGPVTTDLRISDADAHLEGPPHSSSSSLVDVDLANDLDGDGAPDAVVGAALSTTDPDGAIFVVAGPVSGTIVLETDATYRFIGNTDRGVGLNSWRVGDLTGDGIGELAAGSEGHFGDLDSVLLFEGGVPPGTYDAATAAWTTLFAEEVASYIGVGGVIAADYDDDERRTCSSATAARKVRESTAEWSTPSSGRSPATSVRRTRTRAGRA